MKISKPDVRAEAHRLIDLGFTYEGLNGNAHHRFEHPEYGVVTVPNSPSDWRWLKNHRHQVAKAMGISLAEMEIRLGVRQTKSDRPKRSRRRQRQAFGVDFSPARRLTPKVPASELLEAKRAEMRDLSPRCETAVRLGLDEAEALVEQETQLRAEILELEAITLKDAA